MENNYIINDFEGPLDLLLHLIKENKMDIFDIELNIITKQYLAFVEEARKINLEIASEFIEMASTLLEIKSKSLLPNPSLEIEDNYEENTQEQLKKRLIEYYRYKELSKKLDDFHNERILVYEKPLSNLDEFKKDDSLFELPSNIDVNSLIIAMDKVLRRMKFKQPINSIFENHEISIETRANTLMNQLHDIKGKARLIDLVDVPKKSYLIVTFLAILDLAKQHKVMIEQNNDEIYISGVV